VGLSFRTFVLNAGLIAFQKTVSAEIAANHYRKPVPEADMGGKIKE